MIARSVPLKQFQILAKNCMTPRFRGWQIKNLNRSQCSTVQIPVLNLTCMRPANISSVSWDDSRLNANGVRCNWRWCLCDVMQNLQRVSDGHGSMSLHLCWRSWGVTTEAEQRSGACREEEEHGIPFTLSYIHFTPSPVVLHVCVRTHRMSSRDIWPWYLTVAYKFVAVS